MKNLEKFSAKVQYVTPSCKSVMLKLRETILTGSGNYDGRTGLRSWDNAEDVNNENDEWGY